MHGYGQTTEMSPCPLAQVKVWDCGTDEASRWAGKIGGSFADAAWCRRWVRGRMHGVWLRGRTEPVVEEVTKQGTM